MLPVPSLRTDHPLPWPESPQPFPAATWTGTHLWPASSHAVCVLAALGITYRVGDLDSS